MRTVEILANAALLACSKDEILVIHSALNEICNGIELFEFETRIGASRDAASTLLAEIGGVLNRLDNFE